jgi:anaphase-promoting complex subunit 5
MEQFKHADIGVPADPKSKHSNKGREPSPYVQPPNYALREFEPNSGIFLRTNWQIQGYLQEQAEAIEK